VTISEYFQIPVDTLIATFIPNCSTSTQKGRSTKAGKYLFFYTGITNTLSELIDIPEFPDERWGILFEQWTGTTILKTLYNHNIRGEVCFWREGKREINWIVKSGRNIIPIEVKWGESIRKQALKSLEAYIERNNLKMGFVVFTGERKRKLTEKILATPWLELPEVLLENL